MSAVLADRPAPVALSLLVGGDPMSAPDRIEVRNPAHPTEVVGSVVRASPEHVRAAVAAAKAAQSAWGDKRFVARAAAIAAAVETLDEDLEARAVLLVRENGKPLAEARGELAGVAGRLALMLGLAAQLDEGEAFDSPQASTSVAYRPCGVVVSIVPWNAPVSLAFAQLGAALFAGNAVVLKPPETCPLALIRTLERFAAALPPGLVNVVTGLPSEIGEDLVTHPDVAKIGFTGSIAAARTIMARAAEGIKGLTLELGGNDPAILLDDADLAPETMERMARAVFRMSGQICMAIKRIYVPEGMQDAFLSAFCAAVDRLVVGDGLVPGVTMGPLHTAAALARARALVADAERRGAKVVRLGQVLDPSVVDEGFFLRPTVVTGLSDDAPLVAEEQFCPAVPVLAYGRLDEVLPRANDTVYGLGGSVWGRDEARAAGVARRLQAGTVFVNSHGTEAINRRAPYGGMKQSGVGRKAGLQGVLEYCELQTLGVWR